MTIASINPATGDVIEEYPEMKPDQVERIVAQVDRAFQRWRETSFADRADCLRNVAQILRDRSDDFALLMAQEMGKPRAQGKAEAEKCAWVCDYYADHGEAFLQPEMVETDASKSYVTFKPLGTILGIMPWNFPFWQVFRFGAPALMAGNTVLLKHAPNVPGCALTIEQIVEEAGVPQNVFRSLLISVDPVEGLIGEDRIAAVTLTGSTRAGRAVAAQAGAQIKKTVLELGGSDPYVVLADADLDKTVETCAASRLLNSGQSCIAAKRFVVVEAIHDDFVERFVERMRRVKVGDPLEKGTDVGPLARMDLRDNLHRQVTESVERGATCVMGGEIPHHKGAFYPVTVLTDVQRGMPAYHEELFGPVAAVIRVADEEEAIYVANDTVYGLGAAIFTADVARGEQIAAERLNAGACFVNAFVKSDPRLPFGGIKQSGYGRELSHFGIKEFVNVKTVYVA